MNLHQPVRVLIIDIGSGHLLDLEPKLQSAGIRTFLANQFDAVLSDLSTGTFDLVIIGDSISSLDENDFPHIVRQLNTATYMPIIWMPSKYEAQFATVAIALGVDLVLNKDTPLPLILSYISRLAKNKRISDDLLDTVKNLRNKLAYQSDYLEELKSHNDELREMSITDPLTGLFNGRYMERWLNQTFAYSQRYDKPLSLMLIDLDKLKWINDNYGHSTGDKAIILIASVLRNSVRDSDLAARYGGDEFLIALPDTPSDQLDVLADRILEELRNAPISSGGDTFCISCSLGSATYPESVSVTTCRELIELADQALYAAKRAGRSRLKKWKNLPRHHQLAVGS